MFCVVTSLKCLALNVYSGYLYDYYTFLDGQINRHRCTDSPLFDAHEWLGVLAWAESSWGQRRALAVRWQWAFQHILSYASHTKWLGFCVCACVCTCICTSPLCVCKTPHQRFHRVLWRCRSWFWLASDVYMLDTDTCPIRTGIRQLRSCQHVFTDRHQTRPCSLQDHNWRHLETCR